MRRATASQVAVLLVCVLAAWLWWEQRVEVPMRAPRVTAETFDDFSYYYPVFRYAFGEARHGRFPLWNPYQHCGSPFFATGQHLLLYPLNALYLLLPTAAAMKATNILHLALAILFTYVLARTFSVRRAAALTAGVIFAFSPVVTNNIYAPHHLYGAVWIPLQLALVRLLLIRPRKLRLALLLAAALAAQYLGGYPMHCLFSAYLIGLYVLWFAASNWRAISWTTLAALAGAGLLATLFVLPQMLPALELARLSPRPLGGMTLRMIEPGYTPGWKLPLQMLAGTLLPTRNSVFSSGFAPHVGAVGLALAAVGAAFPQRRTVAVFFALVTIGSAALGLGRHTPLYELYIMMPTGDWFRVPNRFFVLTALGLAMLAALGVDSLLRGRIGRSGLRTLIGSALVLAVALNVLLLSAGDQLAAAGRYLQGGAAMPGETRFAGRLAWLCGYLWAASVWLAAYSLWTRGRWLLIASLPLAAYGSLFVSFINYAPLPDTNPELHTIPTAIAQFLKEHQGHHRAYILPWGTMRPSRSLPPPYRAQPEAPQPVAAKSGILNHLYVVGDRENVYPARLSEYASRLTPLELAERMERLLARVGIPKEESLPQGDLIVRANSPNLRLLDLLGTRFIVEGPQTNFEQRTAPERFPLVYESDGVKVYRNAAELPRAFVVGDAEIIAEPSRVLDRLTNPGFDPTRSVILEADPARLPPGGPAAPRFDVRFEHYAPAEVVLHVSTSGPGFLVLTDQHYPGWNAQVDGVPAVIHRADYLFRAVFVDAGEHRVAFRYEPRSFRLGLVGASVGLVLLALALLAERTSCRTTKK